MLFPFVINIALLVNSEILIPFFITTRQTETSQNFLFTTIETNLIFDESPIVKYGIKFKKCSLEFYKYLI